MKIISLWIFLFSFWPMILSAAPMETKDLPETLGSWVPWVLHGQEHLVNCPPLHNRKDQWECSWPSRLELTLNEKGGAFVQDWKLFDESWLVLPGNIKHWPQNVKINGKPAQVVDHNGLPAIFSEVGNYKIEGSFAWEALPEFIQISPQTALVSLSVNQRATTIPDIDANGRVWLGERDQIGSDRLKDQESRLTIRVFRKITDEVPVMMTLHVELDVSGKPREVLLGQGLPKGTTPMSLESSLPARIEPDGKLFVQVRPGSWTLVLTSRYPGPVQEISLDAGETPWPEEEVWVFEARNHLRLVEIQGGTSIDPQQTAMPENWRNLPAYRLVPGETLTFTEKRRGDPDPAPDRLTLQRNIWLDFEGNGYTIQDQIQGTMTRGWRLEMPPPARLGQVMVDGKGQFITRLDETGKTGVEVRQGQIQMNADSRIDGRISPLPIVGWAHDFQQVSAVLNLPPGWRLLNAKGVDDVPGTWLKRWSLLDLFLVLIISLSIAKLWGFQWGFLSLAALALVYHEPHAPRFVWLHILFAIALLRVLPLGRFRRFVSLYRNVSLLSLVIISLPFMVDQVREGIFPQMERPWQVVAPAKAPMRQGMVDEEDQLAEMERRPQTQALKSELYKSKDKLSSVGRGRFQTLQYDPKANIQTGPGLPVWRWRAIPLKWNGPVEQTQTMTLYLLSPKMNMFLAFLRVLLLAGLAFCVLDFRYRKGEGFHFPFSKGATTALLIIAAVSFLLFPLTARAEFPSPEILKELRLRLLEKPDCFPLCADSPRMELEVNEKILRARMEVHSLALTAIPLPGSQDEWLPHLILINDLPAKALFKSKEGQIWIEVPKGIHQIVMEGPLPNRASVQIPLPLKPHRVNAKLQGWSLDGIHENGLPDNNLQLTRVMVKTEQKEEQILETGTLPPFVHVERTLHLGLDWEIHTQLKRLTPPGSAVVVEVPLLQGESVTSEHIRIVDSKALINMSPNDQVMEWTSVFKKQETITLTAPETTSWSEVWRLDVSPIWHVTLSGIPVVHHQDQNRWLPSFRPWPGESVTIAVFRPQGVEGRTLTVDETKLTVAPGLRATDTTMSLKMRSSQGGQHTLKIPANANLQSVSIDGVPQSIRQEENRVTLPLVPGTQNVVLQFQQSAGIGTSYRTPLINLGLESVNAMIQMKVPRNRWVLWTTGPDLGPAILFWGVVLVILFSSGLGRIQMTPLRSRHWLLLGLGLSAAALPAVIFVAAWFFAMGKRRTLSEDTDRKTFNTVQVGLGILTLIALASMIGAIQQGLLGYPDMQIAGNGSSSFLLRWYMDKAGEILPRAGIFTVPMMVYRILMLAWALWLAFALLRWAKWAWESYSTHGIWRSGKIIKPEKTYNPSHTVVPPEDQH